MRVIQYHSCRGYRLILKEIHLKVKYRGLFRVTYAKFGLFSSQCFLPSLVIRKAQAGEGKSSMGLLCRDPLLTFIARETPGCPYKTILNASRMMNLPIKYPASSLSALFSSSKKNTTFKAAKSITSIAKPQLHKGEARRFIKNKG